MKRYVGDNQKCHAIGVGTFSIGIHCKTTGSQRDIFGNSSTSLQSTTPGEERNAKAFRM